MDHTKTGNPLVDSVAEHQPTYADAYYQYLQHFCRIAPLGFIITLAKFGDSPSFAVVYGLAAYFFSRKMGRLRLLLAPWASIVGGIALGRTWAWSLEQVWVDTSKSENVVAVTNKPSKNKKPKKSKEFGKKVESQVRKGRGKNLIMLVKRIVAAGLLVGTLGTIRSYNSYCWSIGEDISDPSIIQVAQNYDGEVIEIDDYREAYNWIRKNTPENARVMAWWDYGYQITSIANRTTIADGNTWNHEHIALLAKILTGPTDEGYEIARHLSDYVLVCAGSGGDDEIGHHMARIANSVYRDMCNDPVCSDFGYIVS